MWKNLWRWCKMVDSPLWPQYAYQEGASPMTAEERRTAILKILAQSSQPVSASTLAGRFGVSRQLIVGDVALLRAGGASIIAAARGYLLRREREGLLRQTACRHRAQDMERERNTRWAAPWPAVHPPLQRRPAPVPADRGGASAHPVLPRGGRLRPCDGGAGPGGIFAEKGRMTTKIRRGKPRRYRFIARRPWKPPDSSKNTVKPLLPMSSWR